MKEWSVLVRREGIDIPTVGAIDEILFPYLRRFAPHDGEIWFTLHRKRTFTHIIALDVKRFGRQIYRRELNAPTDYRHRYRSGLALLRKADGATRRITTKPTRIQLTTLLRVFQTQYAVVNRDYSILPWLALESWQHDFNVLVERLIEKNNAYAMQHEIIAALTAPWKQTSYHDITRARERMTNRELIKHFQFLRSWSSVWYQPYSPPRKPNTIENKHVSTGNALSLLRPNRRERSFLECAPYATFFKDWRDDLRRKFAYTWSPLFENIADALGLSRDDLGYFTFREMEDALVNDSVHVDALRSRKAGCIVTAFPDGRSRIVSIDNQRYQTRLAQALRTPPSQQIHGIIAFHGKVRGRATIVRSLHDCTRVHRGTILIAHTTHPNYIHAMSRAAAFVTDEGGIISHAAIVARELKKPCIVGTKIATTILKNGDFVEVDANKGIVRKL